jgi:eukaryotic-like serine/threonine-protein kinase
MSSDLVAGRYRLIGARSTTRMAEVFEAQDLMLERRVALKLLGSDADAVRFEREARAAAALTHPNIVQVFDYGRHHGRPYMVLEYLEGGTLEERLARMSRLRDDEVLRIARDVAAGLAYAHEHGVVHRDLKPGNVLFDTEGRAKVGDFGIARIVGADTLTDEGTVVGTAAYISPEQVAGATVTPAADVYSFGVLLYRMLSGRLPFESDRTLELAEMHRTREPPPLRSVRPDAPAALAALAMSALAKQPQARPRDGAALLAGLERPGPSAPPGGDAPTMVLPVRRRRGLSSRAAIALGALALVAAGVVAAILVTGRHASAPADTSGPLPGTTAKPPTSASSTTQSVASTASTTTPSTASHTAPTMSRTASTTPVTPPPTTSVPSVPSVSVTVTSTTASVTVPTTTPTP